MAKSSKKSSSGKKLSKKDLAKLRGGAAVSPVSPVAGKEKMGESLGSKFKVKDN